VLCELTGFRIPILAVPLLKDALARRLAFAVNVEVLRSMGVRVLFDPAAPPDARIRLSVQRRNSRPGGHLCGG
jgi:hypothetical protein